ncbi:variant 2, Serine carboxypeptidase-like 29 [Lathyrus oleraceus]|uniref:Variant 2, Serine carboxypeptidase-like 29 n=1 Tax=Pisum sativum TaxID=3888 RepID=A0A9D5BLL3_PEA|nr:variant 2, Serine carboxypeptidase-like 29 [Pisum sativum]
MILAPRSTSLYTSIYPRSKGLYMLVLIISLLNGKPAGNAHKRNFSKISTYFHSISSKLFSFIAVMWWILTGRTLLDQCLIYIVNLFLPGCDNTDAVIPVTSTRYTINALKLSTVSPWRAWYDG